jgi:gamma-glutamyl AIG2-like cyclotransferase
VSGRPAAEYWLFSYGTLREAAVQRAVFGREVEGEADALAGYVMNVIAIPGAGGPGNEAGEYLILRRAHGPSSPIRGVALRVTADELGKADGYETSDYARATVTLLSGRQAFVYVAADDV